jgi:hypothetical protein
VFDLSDVRFVKRILVGNDDPEKMRDNAEIEMAMALLNRCLSETPPGKIIGVEKNFQILHIGEHQVVLQSLCYHVGFQRKPYWLEDDG